MTTTGAPAISAVGRGGLWLALRRVAPYLLAGCMVFMAVAGWGLMVLPQQADRLDGRTPRNNLEDYVAYHAAGRLVLEGRGDEIYDIEAVGAREREIHGRPVGAPGVLAYFNPPFVAAAFAPFTALPLGLFCALLFALLLTLILVAGLIMQRLLGPPSDWQRAFWWLGFLTLYGTIWLMAELQLSMFPLLGWLGFAWYQRRGNERLAGAMLALALVKPHLALLPVAVLLAKRRWTALGSFAAIAAILTIVSVAVSGPSVLIEYPRYLLDAGDWQGQGRIVGGMYDWGSFLALVTGRESPPLALLLLFDALTLAAVALAWRGPWQPAAPRFWLQCGVTLLAALLVSGHLLAQDLVLLALPAVFGAAYAREQQGSMGRWPLIAAGIWLAQLVGPELQRDLSLPLLTPAMALLLAGCVFELTKRPAAVDAGSPAVERLAA